jgi:hypothetical protein
VGTIIVACVCSLIVAVCFLRLMADGRRLREELRGRQIGSNRVAHGIEADWILGQISGNATERSRLATAKAERLSYGDRLNA